MYDVAAVGDGSVVMAGSTEGSWNEDNEGGDDFAAVKLDSNGSVVWKWQVDPRLLRRNGVLSQRSWCLTRCPWEFSVVHWYSWRRP